MQFRNRPVVGLVLLFLLCTPFGLSAQGDESSLDPLGWLSERRGALEAGVEKAFDTPERAPAASVPTVLGISVLLGMVAALLPGRRKTLLATYLLAEDIELLKGVAAGALVALLQGALGAIVVLAAEAIATVSASIATITSVVILLFGLILTSFKVKDAVTTWRHAREESVLSKLKTVSDEIDPEHHDPARDMIFQHRRAGRRRRSREHAFLPAMILGAGIPSPAAVIIAGRAAGGAALLLGLVAVLAAILGAALVFAALAALVIAVKNGGLMRLRARTARTVQVVVELLAAAGIASYGLVLLLSSFG
ncbi:MAG: hypothetical protein GVY29_06705 [Spirochaetes bacterium]|jgi:nickel/cobalt exporter|nr:hypothetical protein [Spirochaetota bacterium]